MVWTAIGWAIVKIVISVAISYLLAPKPDPTEPTAAGLDQFDFPTAQVGRPFPVLFGSKNIVSQNVVWYGDLGIEEVTENVSTGLFSDTDVTVGYKYHLGVHMVLAHEIDSIYKITIEDRVLWSGSATDTLSINKPSFFGGERDGGGIEGDVDILRGESDQQPHDYLQTQLGNDIPAFRGVSTVVLRKGTSGGFYWAGWWFNIGYSGMYLGTSERIKPWGFWCKNIYNNWYPSKAEIGSDGDMNPAHIIHETITNDRWGMGYPAEDIDDTAFSNAADTLYSEGFGLSMLWDYSTKIEDFIGEVLKHIDASLFTDVHTGKFTLKLIRDDYDINTIPVFDQSNIVALNSFRRRTLEDITNSITIKFWNRESGSGGSITRADIAMAARIGGTNNTEVEYRGIANKELAEFVLSRDLRALSNPFASASINTTRDGAEMSPGDPFILSWPRYGIDEIVMRVTAVEYGEFGDSNIRIECAEDIFAVSEASYSAPPPSYWQAPANEPSPCPAHAAIETPYYKVANKLGETETNSLANDVGYASIAGSKPSDDAIEAQAYFRLVGNDYELEETKRFAPYAILDADAGLDDTILTATWQRGIEYLKEGIYAVLGSEIVRIDSSDDTTITVGRGCLDTVPVAHSINDQLIVIDGFLATCNTKYHDGNTVNAKMLPSTPRGTLALADAPEQSISMTSRIIRPYPPARIRVDGLQAPGEIIGDINLEWRHRDRTQQLSEDIYDTEDDINIGPETGTEYSYEIRKVSDGSLLDSGSGITGTTETILNADVGYDGDIDLTFWSIRDTYASHQKQARSFSYWRTHPRITEGGEDRLTEDGNYRIIEG